MSTEIKSIATPRTVTIKEFHGTGAVVIESNDPIKGLRTINVNRVEFLAAVETELGVRLVAADSMVIEHDDWPEVKKTEYVGVYDVGGKPHSNFQPEAARKLALRYFALAEYLDAHPPTPPVDKADIEALAQVLTDVGMDSEEGPTPHAVARRLLATGKVVVRPS